MGLSLDLFYKSKRRPECELMRQMFAGLFKELYVFLDVFVVVFAYSHRSVLKTAHAQSPPLLHSQLEYTDQPSMHPRPPRLRYILDRRENSMISHMGAQGAQKR